MSVAILLPPHVDAFTGKDLRRCVRHARLERRSLASLCDGLASEIAVPCLRVAREDFRKSKGACSTCGNGVREGTEVCDGTDFGIPFTCEAFGVAGTITCSRFCNSYRFDCVAP